MGSKYALLAILFFGFVSQGCSTPPTGDTGDYEMLRQEAWSAYNSCLQALAPYGRTAECDDGDPYSVPGATRGGGAYQPVQVQTPYQYYGYDVAPPSYLYSAEPEELNALTEKWLALAEEPEKAL